MSKSLNITRQERLCANITTTAARGTPRTMPGSEVAAAQLVLVALAAIAASTVLYLWRINTILSRTPSEALKLSGPRWTPELLHKTYAQLERDPPDLYAKNKLPPKLDRRYVVTGGSGRLISPFSHV